MGTFTNWTAIVVAACSLILQLQAVRGQSYFLNPMCGASYPARAARVEGKIMHGKDATLGSAPFMAYLILDGDLHCGGTIISQSSWKFASKVKPYLSVIAFLLLQDTS